MPGSLLYEYAVIRLMPRVEREEFLNLGVIVFCKQTKYLQCKWHIDQDRINAFCAGIDLARLSINLEAFSNICNAKKDGGPIAQLDTASRFRWLTAVRSTMIQTSRVHAGFCTLEEAVLQSLFEKLAC